jgi:L-ascorbate metabolism protein UlaG (beta-lactamase superfamily)
VSYDSSADVTKKLTLIRNATLLLELDGKRLLIDPMLDEAGARPAVENTDNDRRNPLVPLPLPVEEIADGLDAILVTHLHRDHFDDGAVRYLPRDVPLYCQPEDEERLRSYGFDARPVHDSVVHGSLRITRTGGQHGYGATATELGPVSGFVVDGVYIAGDTVWCDEVEQAIAKHRPRVAVVNGSAARFVDSEPLVMTTDDIAEVARRVPTVVVVHLEAINHCIDTRDDVRRAVPNAIIPADGEIVELAT